jgi:dUTPase
MLLAPQLPSQSSYDFDESQHDPINITQSSSSPPSTTNSKSAPLHLISPVIPRYIPDRHLHKPFVHTVHFRRILPSTSFPCRLRSSHGLFTAQTVTDRSIEPGTSCYVPTGISATLPPQVTLHIRRHLSFSHPGLHIVDNPISSTHRGEIFLRISNCGTSPILIHSYTTIAQYHFKSNNTTLVPHMPLSSTSSPPPHDSTPTPTLHSFRTTPHHLIISTDSASKRYHIRRASRPSPPRQPVHSSHTSSSADPATFHNSNITPIRTPLDMHHSPINPSKHTSPSPSLTTPRSPLPSDSVNAALPKVVTMTRQCFLQSIGYRKPDHLLKHMSSLASTPISIQRDSSPRLDPGETATMRSSCCNTTPSTPSSSYSNVWHLDIGYGPCTAIGGIRYTLLAVDKSTRYKLIYGLTNLKSSLLKAIKQFTVDCGVPPKQLRTDFDHKIMGGAVAAFLCDSNIPIQSLPPY